MKSIIVALFVALATMSCGGIPRDTEGTLEQVRERGSFRVGLIAGSRDEEGRGRRLIAAVASETKARPELSSGASEALLAELEEGKLDLVVGTVTRKSPWSSKVHLLPPLSSPSAPGPTMLAAMTRNGENAWVSLLHRQAEKVGRGS